ncbi:Probable alcohol dehydrogenase AdhA, partial [Geodia barretti]
PGSGRARSSSGFVPARSAGPTSTSWDGELPEAKLPLVPGHQIVGTVAGCGRRVSRLSQGDRVGVPWLGWTCNRCGYCRSSRENLCDRARFTGYHRDGGYAEFAVADERYCFPIPPDYPDLQAAPLLCAGLIGFRSLKMTGEAQRVGFYGFGSAAHILVQAALHEGRQVYAFTRAGDRAGQQFALRSGAAWAGESGQRPPVPLDAAIIFAPAGELVPEALKAVAKGGSVICAGIHMSDIPAFPLLDSLGRAGGALGRQSHPARWRGVSGVGGPNRHRDSSQSLCADRRQPGPVGATVGKCSGSSRSGGRLI